MPLNRLEAKQNQQFLRECAHVMLGYGSSERTHGVRLGGEDGLQWLYVTVFSSDAKGSDKSLCTSTFTIPQPSSVGIG